LHRGSGILALLLLIGEFEDGEIYAMRKVHEVEDDPADAEDSDYPWLGHFFKRHL
jgi:hypothetical protein